ncbi:MAG: hypothetical protein L0G99_00845 [Propionibacteriales bacterium]|nr:hypothetical protein [Propionibacteriales bacterium]
MEIPIGKKMILGGPPPSDEDTVRGDAWIASRTPDGFLLTWDAGGMVYTEVGAVISEAQFSLLRRHPEDFTSLAIELEHAGLVHDMPR